MVVCCYNNEIYIFYFLYLSLTVCCYNNEIKYVGIMRLRIYTIEDFIGVRNIYVWYFWVDIVLTQRCW